MGAEIALVGIFVAIAVVTEALRFSLRMDREYPGLEPHLLQLVRKTHALDFALFIPFVVALLCTYLGNWVPVLQGTLSGEPGSPRIVGVVYWALAVVLTFVFSTTAFLRRMLRMSVRKKDMQSAADATLRGNAVAWGFLVVAGVALVGLAAGAWSVANPIWDALLRGVLLVVVLVAAARIVAAYVARRVLLSA